jgi:spermidine/putrescine transport system substrate-binding protein
MKKNNHSARILVKALIALLFIGFFVFVLYVPRFFDNLLPKKDVISFYTFSDLVSPELIKEFEEQEGVTVKLKYADNDIEFWSQLYATGGRDYDLVTPTDFVVKVLLEKNLLQKVKTDCLENVSKLDSFFFHKDLVEGFYLPFAWSFYGIAFNKKKLGELCSDSLVYVFQPEKVLSSEQMKNYKICVLEENPQDLLSLAGIYQFASTNISSEKRLKSATQMLIEQKKCVYAYVASNLKFYLSAGAPVALTQASLVKSLLDEDQGSYGFVFPKEGSLLMVQNFCIPRKAKRPDLAHKLINFFISHRASEETARLTGYLPINKDSLANVRKHSSSELVPTECQMKKLYRFDLSLQLRDAEEAWQRVKLA